MKVRLQVDNQFGDDGPQSGALGECVEIREIEDDLWAYVVFKDPTPQFCIVKLGWLMTSNTENTMSFKTTHP